MSTAGSTGASGIIDLALAGAAVVVTGAGSGIGAATARLLGRRLASLRRWWCPITRRSPRITMR